MPSTYACPGVEVKVIALACVAMIESATAYHGILRSASKKPFMFRLPRPL